MAYTPIPSIMTAPGAPIIESLAFRTRDNPLAVAAGDVSVPLANRVNLALALRTASVDQTRVLHANGAQGWQWGAPPRGLREQIRKTVGGGTWVVPAGVTRIEVELWGAGCNPSPGAAAHGGSGGYVRAVLPVVPGETLDFTIGSNGSPGGTTQISNAGNTVQANATGGSRVSGGPGPGGFGSVVGAIGVALIREGRRGGMGGGTLALLNIAPFGLAPSTASLCGGAGGNYRDGSNFNNGRDGYLRWKYYGP